ARGVRLMADEGEANLGEERNIILQLQSDISRKKEQLDRLRQKSKAFEDEYSTRQSELEQVTGEYRSEIRKAAKTKSSQGPSGNKTADAESNFMETQVRKLLQERIPAMNSPEAEAGGADAGFFEMKDAKADGDKSKAVHDSVLVSYVNVNSIDKKEDDYK
ncbi:unnamed protein product, partial [Polarella glacialis]